MREDIDLTEGLNCRLRSYLRCGMNVEGRWHVVSRRADDDWVVGGMNEMDSKAGNASLGAQRGTR